ncbi:MAG: hypothetical protein ACJ788_26935 [Ktedonobacteraceae bacterium]
MSEKHQPDSPAPNELANRETLRLQAQAFDRNGILQWQKSIVEDRPVFSSI